jgi:hypothetical protein
MFSAFTSISHGTVRVEYTLFCGSETGVEITTIDEAGHERSPSTMPAYDPAVGRLCVNTK